MRGAKFTTISYLFAGLEARSEARCAVKGASIFVARCDRVAAADAAAACNGSDENGHSEPNSFESLYSAFVPRFAIPQTRNKLPCHVRDFASFKEAEDRRGWRESARCSTSTILLSCAAVLGPARN